MKWIFLTLTGMLLLTGCIPANTYIRLDATAGSPIQVINRTYYSGAFSLEAPPGWILTTSHVTKPSGVTLTSQEQPPAVFRFSVQPEGGLLPSGLNVYETAVESRVWVWVLADGTRIMATAQVPIGTWALYEPVFETVRASLTPASP